MIIKKEVNAWELKNELWCGGLETFNRIADNGKENELLDLLDDLYPEGADITAINDFLWFDDDFIYNTLEIKEDEYTPLNTL